MHLRTLRVDKARLDAYQAAADASDMSRQTWMLGALDAAAGLCDRGTWHDCAPRSAQSEALSARRTETTTIDTDVGGNGEARRAAWDLAAEKAGLSPAQWAVIILDAAADISELPAQLRRVM